jgi:hypothetical protein
MNKSVEKGRMIVKWGGFSLEEDKPAQSIRHHHRQD